MGLIHQVEHLALPAAGVESLLHGEWHRRRHLDRRAVLVERHDDLARMQMQRWAADTRRVAIDRVADDREPTGSAMDAQLMGAAGDGLEREPGEALSLR